MENRIYITVLSLLLYRGHFYTRTRLLPSVILSGQIVSIPTHSHISFLVCLPLAFFIVYNSAGHILKNIVFQSGNELMSDSIKSYTGAVNSFMLIFIEVAIFFHKSMEV